MPPVAAAVGAAASAIGAALQANAVLMFAAKFAASMVLSAVAKSLFAPRRPSLSSFSQEVRDRTTIVRSPVSPHRVIYGRAQVSGTLVFAEVTGSSTKYLHLVIVLAGHQVDEIGTAYLNDIPETDSRWSGYVRIKRHLGTPDQAADSDLVAESSKWTTAHRLRGRAYIYVRLKQSRDVFPTGIPNIKVDIKGKPVYDPRTSSTAYSENPALCIADYLSWAQGIDADTTEIDWDTVTAAANACDEQVQIDAGGATQPRYTCNGTFTLDRAPIDILEDLKSSYAGAIVWAMGGWELYAGVARLPSGDIVEDDFRGPVRYRNKPGRDQIFNAVRGTFVYPEDHWQPTDFEPVTNSYYEGQDGERIYNDIDLPFCIDGIEARRNAKVELEQHRQSITATLPLKLGAGLKLKVWRVVRVTLSPLGWDQKPFLITDWRLVQDGRGLGVDVTIREYADAVYDWNYGEATTTDLAPNTTLPDPADVQPPDGLTLSSGSGELLVGGDGTIISRIRVDWTPPADSGVESVEIEYRQSDTVEWTSIPPARAGESTAWIAPVEDGVRYDVRIRSRNLFRVASPWAPPVYGHLVQGKSAAPADVTDFYVTRQPDGTREFSWAPVQEPDLAGYLIRYANGTGKTWDQMQPLHEGILVASPWETNQLAAGTYTVGIKAVDTSGNESANARIIESTLGDPRLSNALAFHAPHLQGWPGTKTDCVKDDTGGSLTAIGSYQWDDLTTWDAWTTWAQNAPLTISYEHTVIDLGASIDFQPLISAEVSGSKTIEIAVSDDGVTYDTWHTPGAPEKARYIKVRVSTTVASGEIAVISSLTIILSGQVIEEQIIDSDTSTWAGSASAGRTVPIQKNYATITSVQLALQNVGSGWSWEILSKSTAGPVIRIYDNTGAAADATVDVVVKGTPTT